MAVCNPLGKASQQHMAHRQQADLEHQIALITIQALEHQRLALVQHQDPQLENQQDLQKPIQTLCLTEDNNGT